jgi:hypothetical protein
MKLRERYPGRAGSRWLAAISLTLPLTSLGGGVSLCEVGTADVGLASAGYTARAGRIDGLH